MRWILVAIAAMIMVSGCSSMPESELEDVTLKLKWVHQSQFAGNYIAKDMGFYEEEGLNVNIEEFTFDNPTLDAVDSGQAHFGITGADELLLSRSEGKPFKALAVIYKVNPVCAYTLSENNITKPQDFVGKTVGIERASDGTDINVGILYKAMMDRLGINRSLVNEVTIGYDATELLNGETDVSTGYIINEPHQAIEAGHDVNTILMADYGVNMYADVLFAREDFIEQNPEITDGFVRATIRGWEYAIVNQDDALDSVLRYAKDRTRTHEEYMLRMSVPLVNPGDSPIGAMEASEWERIGSILSDQGILEDGMDTSEAYTNEFVGGDEV